MRFKCFRSVFTCKSQYWQICLLFCLASPWGDGRCKEMIPYSQNPVKTRVNTQLSKHALVESISPHVREMFCLWHYTCAKFTPSPLCPLEKERSVLLHYLLNYKAQNKSNPVLRTLLAFFPVTPLLNSELSPNKLPVVSSMCLSLPGPWKIVHSSPFFFFFNNILPIFPRLIPTYSYSFTWFFVCLFDIKIFISLHSPFLSFPSQPCSENGGLLPTLHIHPCWSLCTVCLIH